MMETDTLLDLWCVYCDIAYVEKDQCWRVYLSRDYKDLEHVIYTNEEMHRYLKLKKLFW